MNCITAESHYNTVDDCSDCNLLNHSETSSSESDKESRVGTKVTESKSIPANIKLANWAVKYNITNVAMSELLKILKYCYDPSLPMDARTLVKTDVSHGKIPLKDISPGKYYHFGIATGIKNNYVCKCENPVLKLVVGIDGLPLTKSSTSTFWPILGYIRPYSKLVFPIGLYWGKDKPSESNQFLQDFYEEITNLINNGIELFNNNGILCKAKVILDVFCCDVPAKAYVLKTKGHSGFFSCSRCLIEGEYLERRVCFPDLNCAKRTHDDFINKNQEEHHIGTSMSILINIPDINIVNCFSLDYMHLICLGVMRKLINLWLKGPLKVRIRGSETKILSLRLTSLKSYIPSDFQRKPRGVDEINRWKATELRTFLLYLGPIVLKNVISDVCYAHFLTLHVGMFLLLTPNINDKLLKFSRDLLTYFVKKFSDIYGKEWVSHNVHSIQHLCDDYEQFGNLDNCSTFPFENHMTILKKYVRKSHQPLQQAVKRYSEQISFNASDLSSNYNFKHDDYVFKNRHTEGPLPIDVQIKYQYKYMLFKNSEIKTKNIADCYVQTNDGEVVKVVNICLTAVNNEIIMIGYTFKTVMDLYTKPLKSSKLNIFIINDLDNTLSWWLIKHIKCKFMILNDSENKTIAIPIIHTTET